jgi:hypothetical protein
MNHASQNGSVRANVLQAILLERGRQERKFGRQEHSLSDWMVILGEEHGEACKAVVEILSGRGDLNHLYEELSHVGAMAMQVMEAIELSRSLPPPKES